MRQQGQRIEFEKLTPGYEFTSTSFKLDSKVIMDYLKATGDNNTYTEEKIAPPMLIAALAMSAMSANLEMPPGSVHVSQELEFNNIANIDEILISYARVKRKMERGQLHMLTISIDVENQKKNTVMSGETSFILPSLS